MLFNELCCVEIIAEMCSILILAVSQWDGDTDPCAVVVCAVVVCVVVVVLGIYLDFKVIVIVVLLLENDVIYFVCY